MNRWRKPQFVVLSLWALVASLAPALAAVCSGEFDCRATTAVTQCPCHCVHTPDSGESSASVISCCRPATPVAPPGQLQAMPAANDGSWLLSHLSSHAHNFLVIGLLPQAPLLLTPKGTHPGADAAHLTLTTQHSPATWPSRAPPLL